MADVVLGIHAASPKHLEVSSADLLPKRPRVPATSRAGREMFNETAGQTVLQFRLVLQSELEQRIRAAECKLLADVVTVIFDCTIVDKQFRGN